MTDLEKLIHLNAILISEMPQYQDQSDRFLKTYDEQRVLLRSLMNVRPPLPLNSEFLKLQDEFLKSEIQSKKIVRLSDLNPTKNNKSIFLWRGDITTLAVDAIVNAANSALLGCFIPCHACIDNAIHSAAGLQLRLDCHEIMQAQGHEEKTGDAKITCAYNLPSKHVIHTVGPIIHGKLTQSDCDLLESSYRSCLNLAIANNLKSIAFCCISTGEFHFPNEKAAQIAVQTVSEILSQEENKIKVIFNVFKEKDEAIYRRLLGEHF